MWLWLHTNCFALRSAAKVLESSHSRMSVDGESKDIFCIPQEAQGLVMHLMGARIGRCSTYIIIDDVCIDRCISIDRYVIRKQGQVQK